MRRLTDLLRRAGDSLVPHLLALVIPLLILIGGAESGGVVNLGSGRRIDVLTPGVLALAVMSTSFTSLAIATGFERRYGLLKRLGASPLPRSGLLLGKVVALLGVQVLQTAVIGGTAYALGWDPDGGATGALVAVAGAVLGTLAFASLGLALAGTLRAEATLAAANLVYLLLLTGGGVVLPRSTYGAAGDLLQLLPSAALGDALRAALIDGSVDGTAFLVLLGWAAVGSALAARFFRWE